MLAFVLDETLRDELNASGQNYWDVYLEEIADLLGVRADVLSPHDLANGKSLTEVRALIVGWHTGRRLDAPVLDAIRNWVRDGGILIGFGTHGLDDVFGVRRGQPVAQTPDDYAISGYFDYRNHPLTRELHWTIFLEQKLIILSDLDAIEPTSAEELARLFDPEARDLNRPAVTWNRFGRGAAACFAFDAAKTVWLLHQGRPVQNDRVTDGVWPRACDLQLLGDHSRKVRYADQIVFLIQNLIARAGVPFIHQIPPKDGRVADAMLSYGGDEYQGPTELSLDASDWMREKGLGYHINMLPVHPITAEQMRHIREDNRHEVSIYYGLCEHDGYRMFPQRYLEQSEQFQQRFGFGPITTVNKWLGWTGWTEPAKWMLAAGGKSDNSFNGYNLAWTHPLANTSNFSFGFGTSYPFHFYDDHRHGNRRIDFLEQPIACYEVGHRGATLDNETDASHEVHLAVEMAIRWHLVMNMFYHPAYVARYPRCRQAIEEILRYIEHRNANVHHVGNDEVWRWWDARSRSAIRLVDAKPDSVEFDCDGQYHGGMVFKMLLTRPLETVKIDGNYPAEYETRHEFGGHWLMAVLPPGRHRLRISFA